MSEIISFAWASSYLLHPSKSINHPYIRRMSIRVTCESIAGRKLTVRASIRLATVACGLYENTLES